jgi:hypothetical protein
VGVALLCVMRHELHAKPNQSTHDSRHSDHSRADGNRCAVLFFAAASTRLGGTRAQWTLLGVAIAFLLAGTVVLATFPIDL